MCAGSAISSKPPSSYSNNYGYGSAGNDSPFAKEERQWYIDQGFGDPSEVVGKRPAQRLVTAGRSQLPARAAFAGSYRGVSPEARYLYTQSSIPKTVYLQERAPSAASSLGVPASTRWAGNALTINPVSS
jgi:hypothetical protein